MGWHTVSLNISFNRARTQFTETRLRSIVTPISMLQALSTMSIPIIEESSVNQIPTTNSIGASRPAVHCESPNFTMDGIGHSGSRVSKNITRLSDRVP